MAIMRVGERDRQPLRVFISYTRGDEAFRQELEEHLSPLVVAEEVVILQDRDIRAGTQWEQRIVQLLDSADVILALISPLYFHSSFCVKTEMPRALERASTTGVLLIPILLRPVEWQGTAISAFQALPAEALPISKWEDRDDAYRSVVKGLREAMRDRSEALEEAFQPAPAVPPPSKPGGTPANAYDFTHPATAFFRGRTQELTRLCNAIRAGRSVAVFGLQRVGKTSLVERAIEVVTADAGGAAPLMIRIDMFAQWESFRSVLDFFNVIAHELAKAEGAHPASLRELLIEAYGSSFSEYHLQDTFRGILRKSRKITGRPIVLFVDEFQEIERAFQRATGRNIPMAFDAGLMRWLGSLIKDRENILQVLLCCRFHAKDLEQRERLELFKLLELLDLGPLDEVSARSLVRDPVADAIHYDEEAVRRMLDFTGRFPYFIQYLGYEVVSRQRVLRTRQVRRRDVDDCAEEIIGSQLNESRFSVFYEDFKKIEGGQPWQVILALASLAKTERQLIGFTELAKTFGERTRLRDHGHIREILHTLALTQLIVEEKRGPETSYYFGPELLRRWLRQQAHGRVLR
ncbi:MAG: hypothetical protein C5B51_31905 [Terriglobia bacterium]|nr:MAG: hypothetical protein C5B51_31905 [Terriglobia bacterium]